MIYKLKIAILENRITGHTRVYSEYQKEFHTSKSWIKGHRDYPKKANRLSGKWSRREYLVEAPYGL